MMTVTLHSTEATARVAAVVDAWLCTTEPPMPGLHRDHFMALVKDEYAAAQRSGAFMSS